jgi:hypothetical protein
VPDNTKVAVMPPNEADQIRMHARALERAKMVERARQTMDSIARPQRRRPDKWEKGQSGNPGGMSAVYRLARRVFQDHTPEMAAELVDMALHSEDERIRFGCLVAAIDRAGIKPFDFDPKTDGDQPRPTFNPALYTFEELEVLYNAMTLMARKQGLPPKEGADVAG